MEPQLVLALQLLAKHYFTRTQYDIENKVDEELLKASKHRNHIYAELKRNVYLKYRENIISLQWEKIRFSKDTLLNSYYFQVISIYKYFVKFRRVNNTKYSYRKSSITVNSHFSIISLFWINPTEKGEKANCQQSGLGLKFQFSISIILKVQYDTLFWDLNFPFCHKIQVILFLLWGPFHPKRQNTNPEF